MMRYFEPSQALTILNEYHNRIVTVIFVKRTDGSIRTLNGMLNVKRYVNGTGMAYDHKAKNLATIYDLQAAKDLPEDQKAKAYRMINLEQVMEIRCDGHVLTP